LAEAYLLERVKVAVPEISWFSLKNLWKCLNRILCAIIA